MDKAEYHRAEARMYAADLRVKVLTQELQAAERDRDRSVADVDRFAQAGAGERLTSRRTIARQLGMTHPSIRAMVERAATAPPPASPPGQEPIPVLSSWRAQQYIEAGALGELAGAHIAFSPLDIMMESGLHPGVFADGIRINPPTMLLFGRGGEVIGVDNCNAGYGGTGPSASREFLVKLGWSKEEADAVHAFRYVELDVEHGLVRAEEEPIHHCGTLDYAGGALTSRLRPGTWRHYDREGHQYREDILGLRAWITEVLDQPQKYPWAAGERVARVYLSRDSAAALRELGGSYTPLQSPYSVVVEQGELQIWCAAYYATDWSELLSKEQLQVLGVAGLYPDDLPEPGSFLSRFLPRRRERPPYIEISASGTGTLQREPDGRDLIPDPNPDL